MVVGDLEGLVERVRVHDSEHRAEDLLAGDAVLGRDAREDVRRDGSGAERRPSATSPVLKSASPTQTRASAQPASIMLRILLAASSLITGPTSQDGLVGGATSARVASTSGSGEPRDVRPARPLGIHNDAASRSSISDPETRTRTDAHR